jgi:porin
MIPGRPDDKFGASFIYASISDQARAFDHDMIAFAGANQPVRDYELTVELSYQAQIKPGWTLQPSFQYIVHPGGNAPDVTNPKRPIRSGALFGLRTTIAY